MINQLRTWSRNFVFSAHPASRLLTALLGIFACLPCPAVAHAQGGQPEPEKIILQPVLEPAHRNARHFIEHYALSRAKIGLAFSGGGVRSLSQIGVLQVLVEQGIPVDVIVGTSMGSFIAGMFAAGYSPDEIENITKSIDWRSILVDRPPRRNLFIGQKQNRDRLLFQIRFDGLKPHIPGAFTPGQKIQSILTQLTMRAKYASASDFDHLRIPFRAICTDLYSGEKVILREGDLAEAMRASLAFPLLFTPVPWKGRLLVDGGLMDNIPVDEVRQLNADIVIAVDASSGLRQPDQLNAPWEIADQVTTIMQRDRNAVSRKKADVLINIDAANWTNMDFSNIDTMIAMGRAEMAAHLPALKAKIARIENKKAHTFVDTTLYITEVHARELKLPSFLAADANSNGIGRPVSTTQIMAFLTSLVEQDIYTEVYATITPADFGYSCRIHARPNPVLKRVVIQGNTIFPSDTLRSYFADLLNKPLHHSRSEEALDQMITLYRNAGYALARIRDIDFDAPSGTGTVIIDEGLIRKIDISGVQRTKNHVITREFPQDVGDIFNFQDAQRGIDNIFSTGLFDRVSYSLQSRPGGTDLLLKLQEKKYTALGVSVRIDSERKSRSFLEVSDENLFGIGAKFALQSLYGTQDRGLRSKFSLERVFKTYLTFDAEAFFSRKQNFVYNPGLNRPIGEYIEKRMGASIGIGQLVERLGVVNVELQTDRFELSEISGTGFGSGISIINRFTFRSILDTRDQLPYPTKGRYVHFFYDLSSKLFNQQLSKDVSFFRTFIELETYNTIAKKHTFNPRFTMGTADLTTPFVMQFRLNGYEHVFGLRDQELIGRHFILGNFTYRYKLPEGLPFTAYAGLRYDIWGMWENTEKAVYKELNNSMGIFVGLDTFLGAIELAYGKANIGQERFYFTIGQRF
ncbi:MAG: patatin-like phospholipase family protein [Deferribacteres bacterium]|nr:patatin-like phospholipase family protein [Deferribacteres bacterium]